MFLDLRSPSAITLRSWLTISSKCLIRIKYTYCPNSSNETTPAKAMHVLLMTSSSGRFASCILAWPLSSTCPPVSGHYSLLVLLLPNFLFFLWFLSWKLFLASLKIRGGSARLTPMLPPHFALCWAAAFSTVTVTNTRWQLPPDIINSNWFVI